MSGTLGVPDTLGPAGDQGVPDVVGLAAADGAAVLHLTVGVGAARRWSADVRCNH